MLCLLHCLIYLNLDFVCKDKILHFIFYSLLDLLEFLKIGSLAGFITIQHFLEFNYMLIFKAFFFIKIFCMVKILHE